MPSLNALGEAPLGDVGGSEATPPAGDDLFSNAGCFDEAQAQFLNVLESAFAGAFPVGDALIINALDAGAGASVSSVGNVRARAEASDASLLALEGASQILSVLKDRVVAAGSFNCLARFRSNVADAAKFQDAISAAWSMLLADAGDAQADAAAMVRKLAGLADTLLALGSVQGRLSAQTAVAVAAALEARVSAGWAASAVDQAALGDEARNMLAAILAVSDAATASDTASSSLRMVLLAGDTAAVADDPAAALRALEELGDGAMVFCSLRLGGADYQGWVLNTQLRAVTEYRNVPFDSFAILNGRTYAAGDGGIFELAGDTDAGQPIEAWFRPFLTNFGTQKMKRVTDIWLGTSGTGLFVKVHTRNPATGQMTEDVYPVQHAHGDGTDKGRVKVGRGLTSNWWTLTVANVAGAPFEIESIEWKPLVLDRRQ